MKSISTLIIFCIFFINSFLFKNDIKIKRKVTYHRHYGVGDELGLFEIIEFDTLGRLVLESRYHPYQNNDLLNSTSIIYNKNGRTFINCDRKFRNDKGYLECDTSHTNTIYDTLSISHSNFYKYKIKVTNKLNYSDTIVSYKSGKRKYRVTYFRNMTQLKIVRKCYNENGGCLHTILGEDYDSLYEYYENNKTLKETVFLRSTDDGEKEQIIVYRYNKENLLIQIDICNSNMQLCEWKVKINYEYYPQ